MSTKNTSKTSKTSKTTAFVPATLSSSQRAYLVKRIRALAEDAVRESQRDIYEDRKNWSGRIESIESAEVSRIAARFTAGDKTDICDLLGELADSDLRQIIAQAMSRTGRTKRMRDAYVAANPEPRIVRDTSGYVASHPGITALIDSIMLGDNAIDVADLQRRVAEALK